MVYWKDPSSNLFMQQITYRSSRVALAILLSLITVPAASTAYILHTDAETNTNSEVLQKAIQDRARVRAQERKYWNAISDFTGEHRDDTLLPDIDVNDDKTIDPLLSGQITIHGAAPRNIRATTSDDSVDPNGRMLLRRYTRAGYCPESMKRYPIPNFYEMCISLVGENASQTFTKGFINDSAKVRRAVNNSSIPAFKLRMQMLQQALDRATRRTDNTKLPGRPTSPVGQ